MNIFDKNIDEIKSIAKAIAAQFGKSTEVVVHDFRYDYEHSIIAIENGHITGRKVGGCATNLWLEEIKKTDIQIEKFGYTSHTMNGKILRSSTVNFLDDSGKMIGSICINQDVTELIQLEKIVSNISINRLVKSDSNDSEVHFKNVSDILDSYIREGLSIVNIPVKDMNKDARIKFLKFLDSKGVFLIQKSGDRVCKLLSISKYTLYNYLDEIRKS